MLTVGALKSRRRLLGMQTLYTCNSHGHMVCWDSRLGCSFLTKNAATVNADRVANPRPRRCIIHMHRNINDYVVLTLLLQSLLFHCKTRYDDERELVQLAMMLNAKCRRRLAVDCRQRFQTLLTTSMCSKVLYAGRWHRPAHIVLGVLTSSD